jgi:outer membrane protein OmpA-like peptidoglycan-associated protein
MRRLALMVALATGGFGSAVVAQTGVQTGVQTSAQTSGFSIAVNSNGDALAPDSDLTLREALSIANGSLAPDQLSAAERSLVTAAQTSTIRFQLPSGQTVIRLKSALPDIVRSVAIDGTTQAGYGTTQLFSEIPYLRQPVVEITPDVGTTILRGLTITADDVVVKGLSLYGFTGTFSETAPTPPADIFIAHRNPPPALVVADPTRPFKHNQPFEFVAPPKNVQILDNWLGIRPDQSMPETSSAFGVSIFNGDRVTVQNNWIANHDGSGIISSVNATNSVISQNTIVANGLAGMPDAIRLEGNIDASRITENLMCGNDGSAVYLFKPTGSVTVDKNRMVYNGRRLRRSAVYLMGNDHKVLNNTIEDQTASGVVVAANPNSYRNEISGNKFARLEGLSIDLNTWNSTDVSDQQRGDGINPQRDSGNRRKETGNAAINAPKFSDRIFALTNKQTSITGFADAGTTVKLYRVALGSKAPYAGPLTEELFTTQTKANGSFEINVDNGFRAGDVISAVAFDPRYGTSEPAINAQVGTGEERATIDRPRIPACVTPPPPPPPTPVLPPDPIVLKVPKNVHFALDKDFISKRSGAVLVKIAQVLKDNPTLVIELQGHTDPRASDAYNLDLGKRRAANTRKYLIKAGVDPARMTIRSFGESKRATQGSKKLDYARDRRVEVLFKDIRDIEVIVQEDDLQIEE